MGLRSFPVLDPVTAWTIHSGSKLISVLPCDSFPLNSLLQMMALAGVELGPLELPVCLLSTCHLSTAKALPSHGGWSLCPICSAAPVFDFVASAHTCYSSVKHSALLLFIPSKIPNLRLGIILSMGSVENCTANTFSQTGRISVMVSCHTISRMVFARLDLSDTYTRCHLRVLPSTARLANVL